MSWQDRPNLHTWPIQTRHGAVPWCQDGINIRDISILFLSLGKVSSIEMECEVSCKGLQSIFKIFFSFKVCSYGYKLLLKSLLIRS